MGKVNNDSLNVQQISIDRIDILGLISYSKDQVLILLSILFEVKMVLLAYDHPDRSVNTIIFKSLSDR